MNGIPSNEASKTLSQVKQTITTLQEELAGIESQQRDLMIKNRLLYMAPIGRDEAKAAIFSCIDRLGASYLNKVDAKGIMKQIIYPKGKRPQHDGRAPQLIKAEHMNPLNLADIDQTNASMTNAFGMGSFDIFPLKLDGGPYQVEWFYYFFGDLAKKKLDQHFHLLYPEVRDTGEFEGITGMTIEERRAQINRNNEAYDELETQAQGLRDQLQLFFSAGIRI